MAKGLVGLVQVVKMKTRFLQLGYKLPEIFMMMPCGSSVRICEHLHHYLLFHWCASELYVPKVRRLHRASFLLCLCFTQCPFL